MASDLRVHARITARDEASPKVKNFGRQLTTLAFQARHVGLSMARLGTNINQTLGLAMAGAATLAVRSFMDLEESINRLGIVFGENAKDIQEWSVTAAQSIGMAQSQAQKQIGSIGDLMKDFGYTPEMLAKQSIAVMERIADVTSAIDIPFDSVRRAIAAGIKGSFEPLQELGVKLNEAKVKAVALKEGWIQEGEALDLATRGKVVMNIVMRELNQYEGDFLKTQDSLANQLRTVAAEFRDIATTLGAQLSPIIKSFIEVIRNNRDAIQEFGQAVIDNIKTIAGAIVWIIDKWQGLSKGFRNFVAMIIAFTAAGGPFMMMIGMITAGISSIVMAINAAIANPKVLLVVAILGAIALAAIFIMTNWTTLKYFFQELWATLIYIVAVSVASIIDTISLQFRVWIEGIYWVAKAWDNTIGKITGKTINFDMRFGSMPSMVQNVTSEYNKELGKIDKARRAEQKKHDEERAKSQQTTEDFQREEWDEDLPGVGGVAGISEETTTGTGKTGTKKRTAGTARPPAGLLMVHSILFRQNAILRRSEQRLASIDMKLGGRHLGGGSEFEQAGGLAGI